MAANATRFFRDHGLLAADAGLLTAGAFAALTAIGYGILLARGIPLDGPTTSPGDAVIAAVAGVLGMAALVVGPWSAWTLHGRKLSRHVLLGALGGFFVGGALIFVLSLLASAAGMLTRTFTDSEFAGPLIVLGLLAAGIAAVDLWLVIDAVRDLRGGRAHASLDLARAAAAVAALVFAAVVAVYFSTGEGPEAIIFMLATSAFGAATVFSADIVSGYLARRVAQAEATG